MHSLSTVRASLLVSSRKFIPELRLVSDGNKCCWRDLLSCLSTSSSLVTSWWASLRKKNAFHLRCNRRTSFSRCRRERRGRCNSLWATSHHLRKPSCVYRGRDKNVEIRKRKESKFGDSRLALIILGQEIRCSLTSRDGITSATDSGEARILEF